VKSNIRWLPAIAGVVISSILLPSVAVFSAPGFVKSQDLAVRQDASAKANGFDPAAVDQIVTSALKYFNTLAPIDVRDYQNSGNRGMLQRREKDPEDNKVK
jgi:hypothetical protein